MSRKKRSLRGDGRAELTWTDDLRFEGRADEITVPIESSGNTGTTPPVLLLEALAGCMAVDVVDILQKGRQDIRGFRAEITGDRRPDPPRYFTDIHMRFELTGPVSEGKAERAVQLSMDKYCSVFHTLRPDLVFTYEIVIDDG